MTLDSGTFEEVEFGPGGVRLSLSPATPSTPLALLRVEHLLAAAGATAWTPSIPYEIERGAYLVPLGEGSTEVLFQINR